MRVLLSWLKEYIDCKKSPEEIAEVLTRGGIEVEEIEYIRPAFRGVKAGRIVAIQPHPQDSKLSIVKLFDGEKERTIVSGAPRLAPELIVAFAPVGAVLFPEGDKKPSVTITKRAFLGVESEGMLLSEKELGLTPDGEQIAVLSNMQAGKILDTLFDDVALELAFTPNLGYAMSIFGVARELSAFLDISVHEKQFPLPPTVAKDGFRITVEAKELAPRYSALRIDGVDVKPSPLWLRVRLARSGLALVNNIVDVGNYVAHELGQPLHAFDAAKIENEIRVVEASKEEKALFLDGSEYTVPQGTLLIRDAKKLCAMAGILGDMATASSAATRSVLFESAFFEPIAIRKARKALGLNTEAAKRFERGTDPLMTTRALGAVVALLSEICPTASFGPLWDIQSATFEPKKIGVRKSHIERILGYDIATEAVERSFARLHFPGKWESVDRYLVEVPIGRHDIEREIDLVEEVWKLLPERKEPAICHDYQGSLLPHHALFRFSRAIRARLLSEGLQEFINCDLVSPTMIDTVRGHPIDPESIIPVLNPISEEQSILRPSLLPGFLDLAQRNARQRIFSLRGFELGNIHLKRKNKYVEELALGLILAGHVAPFHFDQKERTVDFLDLKGILENLFAAFEIRDVRLAPSAIAVFHPFEQAQIYSKELSIGTLGQIHPAILRKLDLPIGLFFAELNLEDLFHSSGEHPGFRPLAEYPSSERDWTVTLDEKVSFQTIEGAIRRHKNPLLEKYLLLAIFRSEKLGAAKKNVTLRFSFRSPERTLQQEEVDREFLRLSREIERALHEPDANS
jgi:phenylalanyl-tRNA synthetase beta chain